MTSVWAETTEADVRASKNKSGKILPLAIYCDGVAVSRDSLKSVLGTPLNFSDELSNKTFAKFSCGNMPTLEDFVVLTTLRSHLMTVCQMSGAAADAEIKYFSLSIINQFWKLCLSPIIEGYSEGIELRIIGDPSTYIFYPCVAFSVGDEPGQKEMLGCYNAPQVNMPCTKCTYSPKTGVLYDPSLHPLRNAAESKKLCSDAVKLLATGKIPKTHETFKALQNLSLHAYNNVLHDVPMGINNHLFNAPPDLLHTYCAGMMKSIMIWTMTILDSISKSNDKRFTQAKGKRYCTMYFYNNPYCLFLHIIVISCRRI